MHPLLAAAPSDPQAAARASASHLWPRMTRVSGPWARWLEELAGPLGFVALARELSRSAPSRLEAQHGLELLERALRDAGQGAPGSLLEGALAWALEARALERAVVVEPVHRPVFAGLGRAVGAAAERPERVARSAR